MPPRLRIWRPGAADPGHPDGRTWVGGAAKVVKGLLVSLALDGVLGDEPNPGETLIAVLGAIAALVGRRALRLRRRSRT